MPSLTARVARESFESFSNKTSRVSLAVSAKATLTTVISSESNSLDGNSSTESRSFALGSRFRVIAIAAAMDR